MTDNFISPKGIITSKAAHDKFHECPQSDEQTVRQYILRPTGTVDWEDADKAFNRILAKQNHKEIQDAFNPESAADSHAEIFRKDFKDGLSKMTNPSPDVTKLAEELWEKIDEDFADFHVIDIITQALTQYGDARAEQMRERSMAACKDLSSKKKEKYSIGAYLCFCKIRALPIGEK